MSRPRAILLAHRIPYPPDKGDKIRSWRLLGCLSERYDVSLGCFVDDPDDHRHEGTVRALCAEALFVPLSRAGAAARSATGLLTGGPLSFAYYQDRRMAAWLAEQRARGPVVEVGFSSQVWPYLADAAAPVLMDLADADSAKFAAYAAGGLPPMSLVHAREARRLAAAEAEITRRAARTFLVTPEEAAIVAALPGAEPGRIDHYRNGVDTDHFRPGAVPPAVPAPTIVLTGAMDYRPNADAACFFAREVMPIVGRAEPDATFAVVGARPTEAVRALAGLPGVAVTGRVPDVRPYLEAARVAVAPLAVARGVQNKVLEAMAMGTPVVASPGAAAGTGAADGDHLSVAEGAEETARAVLSLLRAPDGGAPMAARARALVRDRYAWGTTLARFVAALPPG